MPIVSAGMGFGRRSGRVTTSGWEETKQARSLFTTTFRAIPSTAHSTHGPCRTNYLLGLTVQTVRRFCLPCCLVFPPSSPYIPVKSCTPRRGSAARSPPRCSCRPAPKAAGEVRRGVHPARSSSAGCGKPLRGRPGGGRRGIEHRDKTRTGRR